MKTHRTPTRWMRGRFEVTQGMPSDVVSTVLPADATMMLGEASRSMPVLQRPAEIDRVTVLVKRKYPKHFQQETR